MLLDVCFLNCHVYIIETCKRMYLKRVFVVFGLHPQCSEWIIKIVWVWQRHAAISTIHNSMWIIFMTDVILSLFKESQQVQSYNMIYAVLLTIALFCILNVYILLPTGRCCGDEKTEWPRRTDKSRTLKKTKTKKMPTAHLSVFFFYKFK